MECWFSSPVGLGCWSTDLAWRTAIDPKRTRFNAVSKQFGLEAAEARGRVTAQPGIGARPSYLKWSDELLSRDFRNSRNPSDDQSALMEQAGNIAAGYRGSGTTVEQLLIVRMLEYAAQVLNVH